jgi:aminoglycoside 3-N-acetyltransferase
MLDSNAPLTTSSLISEFVRVGLSAGQTAIFHTSMKAFGRHIVGGAQAVVDALLTVVTADGTIVMPSHSTDNTEPATWYQPPVPADYFDLIRQEMPPYRLATTPTNRMGAINELFRTYPGVLRSSHPAYSFAAWGKHAEFITANQALNNSVAEQSATGRIYDLDGWVCLLGVGYARNTSLHLADYRAQWQGKKREVNGSAMLSDGAREWVTYYDDAVEADDFDQIGAAFEAEPGAVLINQIGDATVRLMKQRALVDFAIRWMEANRPASLGR